MPNIAYQSLNTKPPTGLNALSKAAAVAAEKASAAKAEAEATLTATLNADHAASGVPPSPSVGAAGGGGATEQQQQQQKIDLGLMGREDLEKMCAVRGEKLQVAVRTANRKP